MPQQRSLFNPLSHGILAPPRFPGRLPHDLLVLGSSPLRRNRSPFPFINVTYRYNTTLFSRERVSKKGGFHHGPFVPKTGPPRYAGRRSHLGSSPLPPKPPSPSPIHLAPLPLPPPFSKTSCTPSSAHRVPGALALDRSTPLTDPAIASYLIDCSAQPPHCLSSSGPQYIDIRRSRSQPRSTLSTPPSQQNPQRQN